MKLIDSNIFLSTIFREKGFERSEQFLQELKDGIEVAMLTDFAVDSMVVSIENRGGDFDNVKTFLSSLRLYKGLSLYQISLEEKILATDLMKKHNLDFDDSLQL